MHTLIYAGRADAPVGGGMRPGRVYSDVYESFAVLDSLVR